MADRGISQTATLEEQEAYLVLLRGKYTQFLSNNPSLQDPLVREQYKALGPEYLKHAPLAIASSSRVFSTRITDSAVLRMLDYEAKIARYQRAIDEKKLETVKRVAPTRNKRLAATVTSTSAVKRMEAYMESNGIGQTEFAGKAGTTDRTLRAFRKTGKVRRDIFDSIARAMGTTREALLKQG
jgi:hypothetical protein